MSSEGSDDQQPSLRGHHPTSSQHERFREERQCTSKIFTQYQVTEPQFRFIPLLGCSIILLNDAEFFFKQVAMFRAIEAMYCIEYYQSNDPNIAALGRAIPERLCKADSIEKQVATTYGLIMFFRLFPCIFTAVPLGYLADKAGRRPVLILHKIGTIVFVSMEIIVYLLYPALPIWVLYISGVGALVGANFDLSLAMLFASYTDVMPSPKQRATLFFITTAMQYIGQAIFPLIAGRLINLDGEGGTAQVSLFVCLATAFLGLGIIIFLFPETLKREGSATEAKPLMKSSEEEDDSCDDDSGAIGKRATISFGGQLKTKLKISWVSFNEVMSGVGVLNFLLLVISMLCTNTAIKSIDLLGLIQYLVVKIGWTFSNVTFVTSIQALVYIANYLALLPSYYRLGAYYRLSSSETSICIMLASSSVLIVGSIFLGFSATGTTFLISMAIYTLGTGLPVVTQAYISNLIEKERLARVLAALSMSSVAGKLAATSLGPYIFGLGINSGNEELKGLLFFFCAVLFGGSVVTVSLVAIRTRKANRRLQVSDDVQLQEILSESQENSQSQTDTRTDL